MDNDHTQTRQQRRAAERLARKPLRVLDRAELLRLAAAMVEADGTVSGVTIIRPEGHVEHLDARILRRGGGP